MSIPEEKGRRSADESRLLEIRREAMERGRAGGLGVRPAGAPFPQASPASGYYGIHLLKEPEWQWQIPIYFFVGGVAGSAGVIGAAADWVGDDGELARKARWLAAGGAMLSGALLVWDLGRPERFLNMLRVFKPQSTMSVGAWLLAAFSSAAAAAKFADIVEAKFGTSLPVRLIGGSAKLGSLLLGMPFHNYTGVLIGSTAIPVWNERVRELPRHFGMSGVQAAVGLLELWGHSDSRALNWLGLLSASLETWEGFLIESDPRRVVEPLKHGRSGWLTRIGGVLSGPLPLVLRAFGAGSSNMRRAAAWSGIAGSLITRWAWLSAGHVSARDWRLPLEIAEEKVGVPQPKPQNLP